MGSPQRRWWCCVLHRAYEWCVRMYGSGMLCTATTHFNINGTDRKNLWAHTIHWINTKTECANGANGENEKKSSQSYFQARILRLKQTRCTNRRNTTMMTTKLSNGRATKKSILQKDPFDWLVQIKTYQRCCRRRCSSGSSDSTGKIAGEEKKRKIGTHTSAQMQCIEMWTLSTFVHSIQFNSIEQTLT